MLRPSQFQDFYQRLGLSPNATSREIKSAYRRLAKQYHPDRNKGKLEASLDFVVVNEAYITLYDTEKRQKYDAARKSPMEVTKKPKSKKESDLEILAKLCIYVNRLVPLYEFIPIYESFNRINIYIQRAKEHGIDSKIAQRLIQEIDHLKRAGDKYETDFKTLKRLSRLFVEVERTARRYKISMQDLASLIAETQF